MKLEAWLDYIQTLHPREIELGLDRVRQVADDLAISFADTHIVTVAGTNGKGSFVSLCEAILRGHGLHTGAYTSPHLHRFNERIRIDGRDAEDAAISEAFARIETARGNTPLTYFEFGTLAAMLLFQERDLDVLILEVGLGGRLDAVNILDPDVAVITSIDIDHQAWLGDDRESIGAEKAGILRTRTPLVLAETDPPRSVMERAELLGAPVFRLGETYGQERDQDGWRWWGQARDANELRLGPMRTPILNADLAASAIQAAALLLNPLRPAVLDEALGETRLAGRFESIRDELCQRTVLFDVAHNPAAARLLASRLLQYRRAHPGLSRVAAVLAIMADKDVRGFVQGLDSAVDIWYIAQVNQARCMPADELARQLESVIDSAKIVVLRDARSAYESACKITGPDDLVLVTGSFFTVSELRGRLIENGGQS